MTGELIKQLQGVLQSLHPDYRFEYDESAAINLKADSVNDTEGLIYIEEVRSGRYRAPQNRLQGFFYQKEVALEVCFCRFSRELEPFAGIGTTPASQAVQHTLTQTRQAIRDRIEVETVIPFIEAMEQFVKTTGKYSIGDYTFSYPTTRRFDSNEVAVILSFTLLQQNTCLSALK